MLERLSFINHIGESLQFGQNGVYVNYSDLHNYLWKYTEDGDKISLFKRGIVKKTIPIVVACADPDEGIQIVNSMMEFSEKDILAKSPGRLIVNNYYLLCYIIGSSKKDYIAKRGYMIVNLEVLTDSPAWIKETKFIFNNESAGSGSLPPGQDMDMDFDYPVDYSNPFASRNVENPGFTGSDFKIIVYGECEDPEISIGEHLYEVDCVIGSHEYLTIDSKAKTIILTHADNSTDNKFRYRNRDSYIFEKIPSGTNQVLWEGNYKFDVILYEERSEPKWT